jgi:transposase-like protein
VIRSALRVIVQELIEAEATNVIGADRREHRGADRAAQRASRSGVD